MTDKVKQVIVMRKDLNMSKGKMVTQGCHASVAFLTDKIRQHISRQDSGFPDMSINNVDVFSTLTDFDLSHDLFYLIDISGGAKDVCIDYIMGFFISF